jgi:hypothetical protein
MSVILYGLQRLMIWQLETKIDSIKRNQETY